MNKLRYVPVFFIALSLVGSLSFPTASAQEIRNVQALSGRGDLKITTSQPAYFQNTRGFLARPKEPGQYPGIVMIHEFWGLNQNIKDMAQELAKNGYIVLAVDLYNGQVTDDQNRARELVSAVDQEGALRNMRSAVDHLRNREKATKIASLGWCFGGGQSLQLSVSDEKLDATVIYYGQLTNEKDKLENIKWPVLGIFGDKDEVIPVQSAKDFQTALYELGIMNQIHIYPGVGHAFANPSGMNYAPNETQDAWDKTLAFLEMNLKR